MNSALPVAGEAPTQVSGLTPMTSTSPPPVAYLQGTLDGVAGMLSMSTDDLRAALRSGSSVSDVAARRG